ncbi:hypothetical protein ACWNPK_00810 [Bacillus atrophaeus]
MKKLNMNKITNTDTQDCFFHADAQGRVYIGKGVKGDITISIFDPTGDVRDFKEKEQITCSDIQLFQQCANGYVFVYYESYEPKVKVFLADGKENSAFSLPSGVSCCLLDEKQQLWIGTVNCYSADLKPSLYLISTDVSQEMEEITCCDSNGEALDVQQLKLTSNAVYAVTSSGVYKQDIQ